MSTSERVEYRGVEYHSLRALARAYGVDFGTFHARLKRGFSYEAALQPAGSIRHRTTVRGQLFESQKAACTAFGVNYNTVKDRMMRFDITLEQAIFWEPRERPVGEKCDAHGVLRWTYWARIRRGWTEDQALGLVPPPVHPPSPRSEVSLKFQYGITIDEYETLLAKNNGLCWICNEEPNPPCIDHDHKTGRVRGILCKACNTAIGRMKDDPSRLRAAAVYLEAL